MTIVDKRKARTAIVTLFTKGRDSEAHAVWDLYDAYTEGELELVMHAGNSPAVREVETLLEQRPALPAGLRIARADFEQIAGDKATRCPSTYLSEKYEEFVQCQRFTGHGGAHTHDRLGDTNGEYAWGDGDAFQYAAVAPGTPMSFDVGVCNTRYAGHPGAPTGNLLCLRAEGHTGDHVDIVSDLTWTNANDATSKRRGGKTSKRRDAAKSRQLAGFRDEYERDANGNIIFPGQTTVEEQLLAITDDATESCEGCHKARQEFGSGFVCANHDA